MYRAPDMPRRRRGTITGVSDAGLQVTGMRQAHTARSEQRLLQADFIWSLSEHKAAPAHKGTHITTSTHGRILAPEVVRARAEQGYARLGIPEGQVLTHPEVLRVMRNQLGKIARKNLDVIDPGYQISGGTIHNDSPESMDVFSEYQMALINSLRRQTAHAPQEMLDEFRDHLEGKRNNSRIFWTAQKDGNTAAIRHVVRRSRELQEHDEFNTTQEGEFEAGMHEISERTATPHHSESDAQRQAERKIVIDTALSKIDPRAAELLRRRFGLGEFDEEQSVTQIAREYNTNKKAIANDLEQASKELATALTGVFS